MISRRRFLFGSAAAGLAAVVSSSFLAAKLINALLSLQSTIAAYQAERKLIQQLRAGEFSAYRHLYKRYLGLVYTYIRKHVSATADVQEMTIDVFITAGRILSTRQRIDTSLSTWLLRLAKEQVIVRPGPGTLTQLLHPVDEENQLIGQALATLSPQEQKMMYWTFYKQYSNLEICRLLGRTESSVGLSKYRATRQLTRALSRISGPSLN
jgi:DNA-directed RNA polymerase specialized sigma24 family protein